MTIAHAVTNVLAKRVCSRCFHSLIHRRCYETVSEAVNYHKRVSQLDKPCLDLPANLWMGYLTSLFDLNIKDTVKDMTPVEASRVFQMLLMQSPSSAFNDELRESVSSFVDLDQSVGSNIFAGLLIHFYEQNKLKKNLKLREEYQESIANTMESLNLNNNYDKILLAYFWMHCSRFDLIERLLNGLTLKDELECFLLIKGLAIHKTDVIFNRFICTNVIGCENVPRLCAKLALFHPASSSAVSLLLQRNETEAADDITDFMVSLSLMSMSNKEILDVVSNLTIDDTILQQVCLNLHQSGQDNLFYSTFITLSAHGIANLAPLISNKQTLEAYKDSSQVVMSFLKHGFNDIVPDLIKKVLKPPFLRSHIRHHDWMMDLVRSADFPLTPENYNALVQTLTSNTRAQLLICCCNNSTDPSMAKFIAEIVLASYKDETFPEVFRLLLGIVGNLSAANYISESLLHTLPSFNSSELLAFVRALVDYDLLSVYDLKFWMVIAYDKKESNKGIIMDLINDLYPDEEQSVYFTQDDLHNLVQLVTSSEAKTVLSSKCSIIEKQKKKFEDNNLKTRNVAKLLKSIKTLHPVLLKENCLLYKIAKFYGVHTAMFMLKHSESLAKDSSLITELVKQIEEEKDYKLLSILLNYYALFLTESIRQYVRRLLSNKVKDIDRFDHFTATQMYYYSYLTHQPQSREFLEEQIGKKLSDRDISHLLMVLLLHYPEKYSTTIPLLRSRKYHRHFMMSEKDLVKIVSQIYEQASSSTCENEESPQNTHVNS